MEIPVPTVQPIGQAHQILNALCVRLERKNAKTTRSIKSVKVAVMNWRMALIPRRIPSATSFEDTTK